MSVTSRDSRSGPGRRPVARAGPGRGGGTGRPAPHGGGRAAGGGAGAARRCRQRPTRSPSTGCPTRPSTRWRTRSVGCSRRRGRPGASSTASAYGGCGWPTWSTTWPRWTDRSRGGSGCTTRSRPCVRPTLTRSGACRCRWPTAGWCAGPSRRASARHRGRRRGSRCWGCGSAAPGAAAICSRGSARWARTPARCSSSRRCGPPSRRRWTRTTPAPSPTPHSRSSGTRGPPPATCPGWRSWRWPTTRTRGRPPATCCSPTPPSPRWSTPGSLGVVDPGTVERWGSEVLEAVGALATFGLVREADVPLDPVEAEHDLDDEDLWVESVLDGARPRAGQARRRVRACRAGSWWSWSPCATWSSSTTPLAGRAAVLAADPRLRAAVVEPARVVLAAGRVADVEPYTAWWLRTHPVLAGRRPDQLRAPGASALAGLLDAAPDLGLDETFLRAIGVVRSIADVAASPMVLPLLLAGVDPDAVVTAVESDGVARAVPAVATAVLGEHADLPRPGTWSTTTYAWPASRSSGGWTRTARSMRRPSTGSHAGWPGDRPVGPPLGTGCGARRPRAAGGRPRRGRLVGLARRRGRGPRRTPAGPGAAAPTSSRTARARTRPRRSRPTSRCRAPAAGPGGGTSRPGPHPRPRSRR